MERLNNLFMKRLDYVEQYITLQGQLNSYLDEVRYGISKSKTLHGIALTELYDFDDLDLTATVRINHTKEGFSIESDEGTAESTSEQKLLKRVAKKSASKEKEDKENKEVSTSDSKKSDKDVEEEDATKKPIVPSFRPFGVLEPQSAKKARVDSLKAVEIACELATTQRRLSEIDDEMRTLRDELKSDEKLCALVRSMLTVSAPKVESKPTVEGDKKKETTPKGKGKKTKA